MHGQSRAGNALWRPILRGGEAVNSRPMSLWSRSSELVKVGISGRCKIFQTGGETLEEVFVIFNEQTGKVAENPVARVVREQKVIDLANHTVLRARDGREIPIEDSAAPIRSDAGEVSGVILVFHDVTEARAVQRQIRESGERVQAALTGSGAGTFRWNIRTNALECDENLDQLFGLPPGETIRSLESLIAIVHPDDRVRDRAMRTLHARARGFGHGVPRSLA